MTPEPNKIYLIDVSFSVAVYKCKAFYEFLAENRPRCFGKPKQESEPEKMKAHINEVLSWQLKNICRALSNCGVKYRYATIAGEDFGDVHRVMLRIYEDITTTVEMLAQKDRRKSYNPTVYIVTPHQPSLIQKLAKQVANSFTIPITKK